MRQPQQNNIHVGLKFKSVHFSADAEVVAVREQANEIDVKLTSSEGHARIEKGWNLQHVKDRFERGDYTAIDPKSEVNISII